MHQQPPKIPLFRSTSAANAAQVDSSSAFTVYLGSATKFSLTPAMTLAPRYELPPVPVPEQAQLSWSCSGLPPPPGPYWLRCTLFPVVARARVVLTAGAVSAEPGPIADTADND